MLIYFLPDGGWRIPLADGVTVWLKPDGVTIERETADDDHATLYRDDWAGFLLRMTMRSGKSYPFITISVPDE